MTGYLTDISNLCNVGWYQWVKLRNTGEKYLYPTEGIGLCLGTAQLKVNVMSQNVMMESGEVLPVQTVRKLTPSEEASPTEEGKRKKMDEYIREIFGD